MHLHLAAFRSSLTHRCVLQDNRFLMAAPLFGYGFAWVGHFIFEKNRPATFKQPIYSLMGDFMMWWVPIPACTCLLRYFHPHTDGARTFQV
jgi:hypothetical protein